MKRFSVASALGVGALVALAVPASAGAAEAPAATSQHIAFSGLHLAPADAVTADIDFAFDYTSTWDGDPLSISVEDVPVNGDIELPAAHMPYDEDPEAYCPGPDIDIAADLSSVTITGQDGMDGCGIQVARLEITLHGGEFDTLTVGSDHFFIEAPEGSDESEGGQLSSDQFGGGGGLGGFSQGFHMAIVDRPTVQDSGASGAEFYAEWEGDRHGFMTGVTKFYFGEVADDHVTADIRVELDLPSGGTHAPMVFSVTGAPVDDSIELENEAPVSNPSDWCGDATVDIAADLSSVTVTGGDGYCYFEEALVHITLHGASFGALTLGEDTLFEPFDESQDGSLLRGTLRGGGGGVGNLSSGLRMALLPNPTLQYAEINGPEFEAYWLGTSGADMSGGATFNFAVAAGGADPVAGDPSFTG